MYKALFPGPDISLCRWIWGGGGAEGLDGWKLRQGRNH